MFLAFCGPMPGSARRYFSSCRAMARGDLADGRGQRARRDHGPDVLHRDEPLEELLVELGR